ncbi:MAG TPA: rod shape-determining protein MreD [Actinomycetota bacterium]|nr:rod shape-determining protein MreD [Actinomycetota bacterium]
MSVAKPTRVGTFSGSGFARPAAVAAVLVAALALQSTLLTKVTLVGVIPQLLFVTVICLAYLEGDSVGVVVGFSAGLLQDFLLPLSITGLTALLYTFIGYAVGTLRTYAPSTSVWMPVFVVAAASAVAEVSYAALSIMLGERWVSLAYTAKIAGLVVLYNTLLTPFVFPVVRKIAERVRPERVVRF